MDKINLKEVIDDCLATAIEKAAFQLTKKYRGQEVFVVLGITYPDRDVISNELVRVNYFSVKENDGTFETYSQFKKRIYITILVDENDRQIWVDELKCKK